MLLNLSKRPLSVTKFIVFSTLFNMIAYHYPLFSFALNHLDHASLNGVLTLFSVSIALFVTTAVLLAVLALISTRLMKFFVLLMVLGNSIAMYFLISYQVILDRTMMGNVFNTDRAEVLSYYHPMLFIYLFTLGIIPAFLLSKIEIEKTNRIRLLKQTLATLIGGIFIMYLNGSTWLWMDKYAKTLGGLCLPWSYTINLIRYKAQEMHNTTKQVLLPDAHFADDSKMIVVLVIGESARAKNFSLYGYDRETNPELKKLNVLALQNSFSSATYTTASVHSMLSFEGKTSDSYEPLPNYLERIGADVIWRSKNWGEPILNVQTYERDDSLKPQCQGEGCNYDEVLLAGLTQRITSSKKNKIFIVLHTVGSHGPTYYTKYPANFEIFQPACKTVAIKECTQQELINAYDNTIAYTDYFLSQVIGLLKQFSDVPSTMIYLSDHGESLGEYGLYLHGTPYSIAPSEQKKIPFILWESDAFLKEKKLSTPSVKSLEEYGQYNIFHTILGAFGVMSPIYDKQLDLIPTN